MKHLAVIYQSEVLTGSDKLTRAVANLEKSTFRELPPRRGKVTKGLNNEWLMLFEIRYGD